MIKKLKKHLVKGWEGLWSVVIEKKIDTLGPQYFPNLNQSVVVTSI